MSICLSVCLSAHFCLSVRPAACLSDCSPACLSTCMPACLYTYLPAYICDGLTMCWHAFVRACLCAVLVHACLRACMPSFAHVCLFSMMQINLKLFWSFIMVFLRKKLKLNIFPIVCILFRFHIFFYV